MAALDQRARMRVAVAGGTGLAGRQVVSALQRAGHEAIVISRSSGVDLTTGDGLDRALSGVDAVIDVTNTPAVEADAVGDFFAATTGHLLDAERRAGTTHHAALSILGVDRVDGNAHYAGKRHQELLVERGPTPYTIVRAAQFHEFAAMVVSWTRRGQTAVVPPLLVQPVAVADVADVLVEVATSAPSSARLDLAGPRPEDLVDMARRTLARRGGALTLIPSWRDGPFGAEMAGDVLLPGPDARLATTTFDAWLADDAEHRAASHHQRPIAPFAGTSV